MTRPGQARHAMDRAEAATLVLLLPAAALALTGDGAMASRAAHAAMALAAGLAAWRPWRAPHPWSATLLVALAPPLPMHDALVAAAALAAWAAAPALGPLLAFPLAAQALGHGALAWSAVLLVALALGLVPRLAARARPQDAPIGPWGRAQPLVFVGAALFLPAFTEGGLHAAYAWAALAVLLAVQGWAVLLAWQARAPDALAGPMAAAAVLAMAAAVALLGLGRPAPFLVLFIALAAPALPSVLALATRRLGPTARGPVQGITALVAALALRGLPV